MLFLLLDLRSVLFLVGLTWATRDISWVVEIYASLAQRVASLQFRNSTGTQFNFPVACCQFDSTSDSVPAMHSLQLSQKSVAVKGGRRPLEAIARFLQEAIAGFFLQGAIARCKI
jgi:hypothetical protein